MTAIAVFRKGKVKASLANAAIVLAESLLSLWLAHRLSSQYPRQMAVVTAISVAAVICLLFWGVYVVRNVLLRKPLLWTDGIHLVYMAPYEVRIALADIEAYKFNCGIKRAAGAPIGVRLILRGGKRCYIPLRMAETTEPVVRFLRGLTGKSVVRQALMAAQQ